MNFQIFFIFLVAINCSFGQQNLTQYTDSVINLVYIDSIVSNEQEDKLLGLLDSMIIANFFKDDSLLDVRLNKYVDFINMMTVKNYGLYDYTSSERALFFHANNYHYPQKYSHIPYDQIPDSMAKDEVLGALSFHSASKDTHFLKKLFRTSNSKVNRQFAYNYLYSRDSFEFQDFYLSHFDYIKRDTDLYFSTFYNSRRYGRPMPLIANAKELFIQTFDTSMGNFKLEYDYIFENGEIPTTVIWNENREKDRPQREQLEREKEEANRILEDEYMNVRDSLNWISLKTKVPQYFNAIGDTTLWDDNGDYPMWTGDDGMRFDTFSTEEIFNRLSQINFVALYDTIKSEGDLNASATAIHMRKMLQIIGDRNIYRGYTPSSSQMLLINHLIDLYTEYLKQDTLECMSREARWQMQRLWNLAENKYIDWPILNNEFLNFEFVNAVRIHATESLILAMISRADAYELAGNHDLAYRYIKPLMSIYEAKFIENIGYAMPARRPFRTLEESNRWCFDYIIPALQRFKFID